MWVFADTWFQARARTWDGLEYDLRLGPGPSTLQFSVSGVPPGSVHIPQIVGPWDTAGEIQYT